MTSFNAVQQHQFDQIVGAVLPGVTSSNIIASPSSTSAKPFQPQVPPFHTSNFIDSSHQIPSHYLLNLHS